MRVHSKSTISGFELIVVCSVMLVSVSRGGNMNLSLKLLFCLAGQCLRACIASYI